ncbi:MAG: EamA family transporter [Pseudomonadota bacterium]
MTTEFLPQGYPFTLAMLRALPAGLLLLLLVKVLPGRDWWGRILLLGALNFSVFWFFLFVAAYRLPGGVAATLGAIQPLIVLGLAAVFLRTQIKVSSLCGAALGLVGVAVLVLTPEANFDPIGVLAAIGGACSMAAGTVLSRKWQPPVSLTAFTAWQLVAGGAMLLPFSLWLEPPLPPFTGPNILGLIYMGLIGAAITYLLWFRGIATLGPTAISTLGFLSPITALLLGWIVLDQSLSALQVSAIAVVITGIVISQQSEPVSQPKSVTA